MGGHEALRNGISALITQTTELRPPFNRVRTQGEGTIYEPWKRALTRRQHAGTLILGLPSPHNRESKFVLFISHPVSGAAPMAKLLP